MHLVMPDCDETTQRLWSQLESENLSLKQKIGLALHLSTCKSCKEYSKTLSWVSQTIAQIPESPKLSPAYQFLPSDKEQMKSTIGKELTKGNDDSSTSSTAQDGSH